MLAVDLVGWGTAFLAVAAFATLVVGVRSIALDHERRKKQATLEFWNEFYKSLDGARRLLTDKYPQSVTITKEQADELATDKSLEQHRAALQAYLGGLERLAVGVELGIYDKEVLFRLARSSYFGAVRRFENYIKAVQDGHIKHGQRTNYSALIHLVEKFRILDDPNGDAGQIDGRVFPFRRLKPGSR